VATGRPTRRDRKRDAIEDAARPKTRIEDAARSKTVVARRRWSVVGAEARWSVVGAEARWSGRGGTAPPLRPSATEGRDDDERQRSDPETTGPASGVTRPRRRCDTTSKEENSKRAVQRVPEDDAAYRQSRVPRKTENPREPLPKLGPSRVSSRSCLAAATSSLRAEALRAWPLRFDPASPKTLWAVPPRGVPGEAASPDPCEPWEEGGQYSTPTAESSWNQSLFSRSWEHPNYTRVTQMA
jgi:hypothetical protein